MKEDMHHGDDFKEDYSKSKKIGEKSVKQEEWNEHKNDMDSILSKKDFFFSKG
jgi:hypothetical protein